MIEFTTLFLGFVLGLRHVEVTIDEEVAAVVFRLDGELVAQLEDPPWSAEIDFGQELEPHRLEAWALDRTGRPLGQTRQLVNYARADYGAALALDPAGTDGRRRGRVLWAAVLDQRPGLIDLRFDARPVGVAADGSFHLPSYDSAEAHFLTAKLFFPDGHQVTAELSFGGVYGERVTSALTAVPVTSPPGRPWTRDQVRGWLEHDGRPPPVFAAKAEEGTLLLVRDAGVKKEMKRLEQKLGGMLLIGPEQTSYRVTEVSSRPLKVHKKTFQLIGLGTVDRLRGLSGILLDPPSFVGDRLVKRQHLWDAVALAGRHAAASNRPRAVLLLSGPDPEDHSFIDLERARHYLESILVPLYVWTPEPESLARLGLAGEPRTESGPLGLGRTIERVSEDLRSQTLVWLEGEFLPARLVLGGAAPQGVELVR